MVGLEEPISCSNFQAFHLHEARLLLIIHGSVTDQQSSHPNKSISLLILMQLIPKHGLCFLLNLRLHAHIQMPTITRRGGHMMHHPHTMWDPTDNDLDHQGVYITVISQI